ncbi:MAG: hypothetical protein H7308_13545, partial [Chthonomonadaceae bacterium]|nr:hypothetical protein [Chthonomonadaceae bacterium]
QRMARSSPTAHRSSIARSSQRSAESGTDATGTAEPAETDEIIVVVDIGVCLSLNDDDALSRCNRSPETESLLCLSAISINVNEIRHME